MPRIIKIGLVAPFEGEYRYVGYDAIYAARLAIQEINAAGGADGWQLELVAYDDRAAPANARTVAQNLIIDETVVAVIGHYRQTNTAAAATMYAAAELPLLAIGGWLTPTSAPVWQLAPAPHKVATQMLNVPVLSSSSTIAVWGNGLLADALDEQITAHNYRRVPAIAPQQVAPPPDVIFSTLPPRVVAERLVEWRAAKWSGTLVGGTELAAPAFAAIAAAVNNSAPVSDGAYFITPYPLAQDLVGLTEWRAAYRAVGPHVPEPGPYALPTYEAVHLLAQAIATAAQHGAPTRATVAAALPDAQRDGHLGPITWDENGFWVTPHVYTYRWQNNKPHLLP